MGIFEKLDLRHAARVFAVGDIHGQFDRLEAKLVEVNFDKEMDHILSVGDLVDRGPQSHLAIEYAVQPWFHHVRGNHEQLCLMTAQGRYCNHKANGGQWFIDLPLEEQARHVKILWDDAPTILEVTTPAGNRVGIIHASLPYDDWSQAEYAVEHSEDRCLWDREQILYPYPNGIAGIDYVIHGHTPLKAAKNVRNVYWIDTGGAFADGFLTMVQIP